MDDDDSDSDGGAHSMYRSSLSSTGVNALESRTRPLRSTATGIREQATMTPTVFV
jgi:hypothetical protein